MEENPKTIVEEREELMVSFTGNGNPILRIGHFLEPSSIDKPFLPSHSLSSSSSLQPTSSKPSKPPLKVTYNGWRYPARYWKKWIDSLHSKHQSTWRKVGIYESIMASTYEIRRDDDLVFALAEKWCPKTNTFVFPWGEATITLEDMIILGGYSVLGGSVLSPIKTDEMKSVEDGLLKVRQQISKTQAQKASIGLWIQHFMENDTEIEHEAFLSFWLSRYIFPTVRDTITKHVFPIAIRLARGIKIALAPAVLAHIYRDLSLFKEKIVASMEIGDDNDAGDVENDCLTLTLWSPFHSVQIWAWERFVTLRPKPNSIEYNEVRMARWHKMKKLKDGHVRLALDSARDCFQWRPYTLNVNNCGFPNFYRETEEWVMVDSDLDVEFESFARCLRVSELVGIDCIEQYLPHRVSMQFGFDQDLPGHVGRCNENPKIAWKFYNKPIWDVKICIPSRLFESDVTTRYLTWWKESVLGQKDSMKKGDVWQRRNSKRPEKPRESVEKEKGTNYAAVPPGFTRKWNDRVQVVDSSDEDELTLPDRSSSKRLKKGLKLRKGINNHDPDPDPPRDFPPKCDDIYEVLDSDEEDELTVGQFLDFSRNHNIVARPGNVGKCTSDAVQFKSLSSSTAENEDVVKMELWVEQGEKVTPGEAATGGSKKDMDLEDAKSETRCGGAANNNTVSRNISEGKGESIGYDVKYEVPGFELEVRISRLEKVFSELKAKKYAHKFEKNLETRGPSIL